MKAEMPLMLLFILIKMIIQNYWWIPTLAVNYILIRKIPVVLWYIAGLPQEAADSVDTLKERAISIRSVQPVLSSALWENRNWLEIRLSCEIVSASITAIISIMA